MKMLKEKFNGKVFRVLFFCLSRVFLVYVAASFFYVVALNGKAALRRSRFKALNRLRPPYVENLVPLVHGEKMTDDTPFEEYLFFYKNVVQTMPKNTRAWGMLGFCYYHAGDIDRSISSYEKAVKLGPNFVTYQYNLGLLYFQKEDYKKAEKYLQRAVLSKLSDSLEVITTSRLLFPFYGEDKVDGINKKIKLTIREHYLNSYKLLILINYRSQNYPKIVQYATEAVIISLPEADFFIYYLGLATFESFKYPEASVLFKKAVEINPLNAKAFGYLGLSLKKLGQEEAGNKALQQERILLHSMGEELPFEKFLEVRVY